MRADPIATKLEVSQWQAIPVSGITRDLRRSRLVVRGHASELQPSLSRRSLLQPWDWLASGPPAAAEPPEWAPVSAAPPARWIRAEAPAHRYG